MKCVKIPVFVYYIAYSDYDRQGDKELKLICDGRRSNFANNLLKKTNSYEKNTRLTDTQHMRCTHFVYCVF